MGGRRGSDPRLGDRHGGREHDGVAHRNHRIAGVLEHERPDRPGDPAGGLERRAAGQRHAVNRSTLHASGTTSSRGAPCAATVNGTATSRADVNAEWVTMGANAGATITSIASAITMPAIARVST